MSIFDEFIEKATVEIVSLAENYWSEYKFAAINDGENFLEQAKIDLERWTRALAKGDLTREDFEWLVLGKRDLAKLISLKQAGLSKIALDKFKSELISSIVSTAFKTVV
ncbi:MAG: hypothetical protein E2602_05915 [Achromobacter sp.]|nr:hypothetical protein [Achromobacter sp.]